jgi:hypothetical protein
LAPYEADTAQLIRVHAVGYLEEFATFCGTGGLDPATFAKLDSWTASASSTTSPYPRPRWSLAEAGLDRRLGCA